MYLNSSVSINEITAVVAYRMFLNNDSLDMIADRIYKSYHESSVAVKVGEMISNGLSFEDAMKEC